MAGFQAYVRQLLLEWPVENTGAPGRASATTFDNLETSWDRLDDDIRQLQESGLLSREDLESAEAAKAEHRRLRDGQSQNAPALSLPLDGESPCEFFFFWGGGLKMPFHAKARLPSVCVAVYSMFLDLGADSS